jgi:inosose dehydratase
MSDTSRREFLQTGAAAALGVGALSVASCGTETSNNAYAGFRMCLGSVCLSHFPGPQAAAVTKELGFDVIDVWCRHSQVVGVGERNRDDKVYLHQRPEYWSSMKQAIQEQGLETYGYGVAQLTNDFDENRRIFEWAKANGIQAFWASPHDDAMDNMDDLIEEFDIAVGVHNHGPNDKRWGELDKLLKAMEQHHPKFGSYMDMGHYWKMGVNPIDAIEAIGDRLYGIHFHDKNAEGEGAMMGEGAFDIPGILRALKRIGYSRPVTIEVEGVEGDPTAHLAQQMANLRRICAELG